MDARPIPLEVSDLANLWAELPNAPSQIALLAVCDGGALTDGAGRVDMDRIRAELEVRTRSIPRLRSRLGEDHGRPALVPPPTFRIADHVRAAPAIADEHELLRWAGDRSIVRLPRDRPLWWLDVVEGLPDGRVALLLVAHHLLADGLRGVALFASLCDGVPDLGSLWERPPSPPGFRTRAPRDLPQAVRDLRARAPRTSLPERLSPARSTAVVRRPLDDLRAAAHRHGVTINDLLLTAVSGGVRALLRERGDAIDGVELLASVPVGATAQRPAGGVMIVPLPLGPADALERLERIHLEAAARKQRAGSGFADLMRAPRWAARPLLHWMRRSGHRHINLYVTNVPGPPSRLTFLGASIERAAPIAPLLANVPLGVAALSYAGELAITINGDGTIAELPVAGDGLAADLDALVGVGSVRQ